MSKIVLTVDDSRTMREMLMLALSNAGYRVVQAEDGMHGLEVLKDARPDVIITDINMPRMDGFGFIEGRARRPSSFPQHRLNSTAPECSVNARALGWRLRRILLDHDRFKANRAGCLFVCMCSNPLWPCVNRLRTAWRTT